jgi:hypothetical protein
VGRSHQRGRVAGGADVARVSCLRYHARAAQDVADRGAPGHRPARLTCLQDRPPCRGAPRRVSTAPFDEGVDDVLRRLRGAGAWFARAILQTRWTGCELVLEPRVARLTTDAVPCAPRCERQCSSQVIGEALGLLVPG